jgi:hypothetical protein
MFNVPSVIRETKYYAHTKQQVNYSFVYSNLYVLHSNGKTKGPDLHGSNHSMNLI